MLLRAPGLGLDLVCGPAREAPSTPSPLNGRALPRGGRGGLRVVAGALDSGGSAPLSRSVRRCAGAKRDERLDVLGLGLADEQHLDDAVLDGGPLGGEPGLSLRVLRVCPLLLCQLRAP